MLKLFQGLSKLLANYTSIFVIGVAVFTFFFPHTFDLNFVSDFQYAVFKVHT